VCHRKFGSTRALSQHAAACGHWHWLVWVQYCEPDMSMKQSITTSSVFFCYCPSGFCFSEQVLNLVSLLKPAAELKLDFSDG
jgi:hypothetical protein